MDITRMITVERVIFQFERLPTYTVRAAAQGIYRV